MPLTLSALRAAFDREYPGENWDEECAGAAYFCCRQTGTVTRAYASATAARLASRIVSTDPAAAPAGAFHFWSYPARINGVYLDWGHVAMSVDGGRGLMSNPERNEWDWGTCLGVTDIAAWTARRRGIVTYLGWSYTYGENTASITTDSTAGDSSRPFPGGFLMALSDAQQAQMYDALVKHSPGGDYYVTDALINIIRGEVSTAIASIAAGGILYPGAGYAAFPALANAIHGLPSPDVDEKALAASLAPALAPLILDHAGTLTDDTLSLIASRVADEQAKRLAK